MLANRRDRHKKRCAASTPVHFCKGPSGKERGNADRRKAQSRRRREWRSPNPCFAGNSGASIPVLLGMAEPQSLLCWEWRSPNPPPVGSIILPSQDNGTPNPSQIPIQYISPVPPVKKTYEWHVTTALWVPVAHIGRSIVLAKGDMSSNNKPRNLIPRPQGLSDLT